MDEITKTVKIPSWAHRIGPYGIVGAIATAIDYSTFILAIEFGCSPLKLNIGQNAATLDVRLTRAR
jgi:hypothetical protein